MYTKNNSAEASGLNLYESAENQAGVQNGKFLSLLLRQKSRERQLWEFCPNKNFDPQPRSMKKTRIKYQYFLDRNVW